MGCAKMIVIALMGADSAQIEISQMMVTELQNS
jgi:hypothetical protein